MVDEVVLLRREFVVDVFQVVQKHFFRDLCLTERNLFDRFAIRGLFGVRFADASSEEVFLAVDLDGSMVDGIDLLA